MQCIENGLQPSKRTQIQVMSIPSTTLQIAINLYDSLCCTLHARSGVHSPYNIMDCPPRFRQTAFISVLPRTTTKSALGISSEDSKNKR